MNKSTVLLVVATVTLVASSVGLLYQVHVERSRADTLQARVTELERRVRVAGAPENGASPSGPMVGAQGAAAEIRTSSQPKWSPSAAFAPGEERGWDGAEYSRRLTNPTYRDAELARMRLELEEQYSDLTEALNLTPQEADRFLVLLAKQALSEREYEMNLNDEGRLPNEAAARERLRQNEERARQAQAERAALLGEAKLQEWRQYVGSLPARAQMRDLQTMLAETDYPLRSDQVTPMVAALAAEHQRHAAERTRLYNGQGNPTNTAPEAVIEYMGQRLELVEQSLERRRRIAATYLSSEQQKRYDQMLARERKREQIEHDLFVSVNQETPRPRP